MDSTLDFRLIKQLWMFMAVAEEQHFGRAAKRLHMSQPPLTEHIKVLEHALKLKLFDRSRQGTTLSPAGAAVLPAVQQFAGHVERLQRVVREVAAGQSGVLHIGAITSAMLETVPALLEALRHSHPQLTVLVREIDSVEAVPRLQAGELDLAFARLDAEASSVGISTLPLADDRLAVALQRSHALAQLPRVPMGALAGEHLVMSARQVSPAYFDLLTGVCRAHGFNPRVTHEVRSVASQIAYVGCGQGVALVPASMGRLAPDNVVVRPLKERVMVITSALAWSTVRHNPLVDVAVAWLTSPARLRSTAAARRTRAAAAATKPPGRKSRSG